MMGFKDAVKILGLDLSASKNDIRKAYRELAVKNHPDKFLDEIDKQIAEKNFKKIQEAYDFLMNLTPAVSAEDRMTRSGYDVQTDKARAKNIDALFKSAPMSSENTHWSDVTTTQQKIMIFLVAVAFLNIGGLILMIYWRRLSLWISGLF